MNALISIATNEQGLSVVSARDLHSFLGVKSRFADWFKNRVDKYGFVDGQDFVTLSENLENGGRELDYALTLDCAKELAMVQSNEKGRQARLYFIEAEKQLRQVAEKPALPSTENLLLQLAQQQTQLLTNQQSQIEQLRSDIGKIQAGTRPVRTRATQLTLPHMRPSKDEDLRRLINQRVNEYCERYGVEQGETYRYLYQRMQAVFGLNVYQLVRRNSESLIDAVERYGHLHRLYSVVKAEIDFVE